MQLKFGMSKEDIKRAKMEEKMKKEQVSAKDKYIQLGYDQKDVMSALIKEMRLGNLEEAMYWGKVMEEAGDVWNMCRRLLIFSFEDGFGEKVQIYSTSCWQAYQAVRDNNIWFAWLERLCRSTKFWEVPEGEEREAAYNKAEKELGAGKRRPIPDYAKDCHCKAGYQMKREKGYMDNRFSGDDYGRWNMIRMHKKLGKLDPNDKASIKAIQNYGKRSEWKPKIMATDGGNYLVESQTGNGHFYEVQADLSMCQCPHYMKRLIDTDKQCKHMMQLEEYLKKEGIEIKKAEAPSGDIPF